MGRMRYEMMEENQDYDMYQDQYQERYQDPGLRKRYAGSRATLRDQQDNLRGKNIFVYTNGTPDKVKVVYSKRNCRTLEALFIEILKQKSRFSKIRVDCLYKWPSGEMVSSLADVEENGQFVFVCSDKSKRLNTRMSYHSMDYGGTASRYGSEKPSPTSTTRSQRSPMRGVNNNRPITVTVISNTHRNSRQSVFVNINRPFDDLLKDVTEMLDMANPPCTGLYSKRYPHDKAESNSSFRRLVLYKGLDQFYAVGREGEVFSNRDSSPMRNGHGKQKSKNGYRQNGRMSNGYDKNNGYEDNEGRTFRRHQDSDERRRPDGNDNDDYSPDDDRRQSPERQRQVSQRQDSNDRSRYESYEDRRNDYGGRRQESEDRKRNDRNDKDRDDRRRDESHDRNRDTRRYDRSNDRRRNDSQDRRRNDSPDRRRNDSPDRGRRQNNRDTRGRDESRDRGDARKSNNRGGRKTPDDDDDRNQSRGNSPTGSEMNARIFDMDGDGKDDLDKSVEY